VVGGLRDLWAGIGARVNVGGVNVT
jgi:hypothetical protein